MKKSAFTLFLSIFLCLSLLSGCGNEQLQGTNEEKVSLNIFQFKVEISSALEEAAKLYTKQHPNVTINVQTVGGGDDYGASLRAKMQSGDEADIFNIGGPQDVEDWQSKLQDLSDQPWVQDAVEGTLPAVTVDGKVYGLPFGIEGYGFIYNTEIFKAAGIDASTITSYDTLLSAVQTLDEKIKNGDLKDEFPALEAVFEFPAKEKWVTGLHTSNAVMDEEFPSPIDSYKAKTIEFKYSDALKDLIDLQADYSPNANTKSKLNAVDYATQVGQGIAIERVAMIQQGNWIYGDIKNVDEAVAQKMELLPIPLKGVSEDTIPIGVPMYWCVNKTRGETNVKAAEDFLNWLYTSAEGKDIVVNKFYFIPPLKGYDGLEAADPLSRAVQRYANEDKTRTWTFMGYPSGWGEQVLGAGIQKYLAGEQDWDTVIETAKSEWEKMRAE